jgi:hypothetical protein
LRTKAKGRGNVGDEWSMSKTVGPHLFRSAAPSSSGRSRRRPSRRAFRLPGLRTRGAWSMSVNSADEATIPVTAAASRKGRMTSRGKGSRRPIGDELTSYMTRIPYQETLFFLIPCYAYSTVMASPRWRCARRDGGSAPPSRGRDSGDPGARAGPADLGAAGAAILAHGFARDPL